MFVVGVGMSTSIFLFFDYAMPGPAQVVKDSLTLHRIAASLRKRRYDSGALR
jgi:hypothetical protein